MMPPIETSQLQVVDRYLIGEGATGEVVPSGEDLGGPSDAGECGEDLWELSLWRSHRSCSDGSEVPGCVVGGVGRARWTGMRLRRRMGAACPVAPPPVVKPPTTKPPVTPPTTGKPPAGARIVTAGAYCKKTEAGQIGYTKTGAKMTCKTSATDSRYRWRQ